MPAPFWRLTQTQLSPARWQLDSRLGGDGWKALARYLDVADLQELQFIVAAALAEFAADLVALGEQPEPDRQRELEAWHG